MNVSTGEGLTGHASSENRSLSAFWHFQGVQALVQGSCVHGEVLHMCSRSHIRSDRLCQLASKINQSPPAVQIDKCCEQAEALILSAHALHLGCETLDKGLVANNFVGGQKLPEDDDALQLVYHSSISAEV